MTDQQGYWLCPNCGEVPGEQVTYEEYHNICGSKVTEMLRTPPTTEEAELWKEKIQDIIRKNIKTCILDGGEMKTPEAKIGIMGEYNAATEILELLRRRSEQKTELPIEELKKIFAGYINWCGNGLKPDLIQLDNLFRYLTKSGCVLTRNGFKWESEQNSEAIDQDDEEEDLYSAIGKAREEHELREFLGEVALERADFVKVITKFFPHERSPSDPKDRNMYLNIRVAAENILILYDQMVERLTQKQ